MRERLDLCVLIEVYAGLRELCVSFDRYAEFGRVMRD